MDDFETHPVGTAARIAELEAALTRANAATAAAYKVAAEIADLAEHDAQERDWRSGANQADVIAKRIRALATPDQIAALDKLIAEVVKPLEDALTFYQGAWKYKINKRYGGLEWSPKEELLDDCGNKAKNAMLAASKKGGV